MSGPTQAALFFVPAQEIATHPGQYQCLVCRSVVRVQTHHVDGDHSNNAPENLAPLCDRCHTELHRYGGWGDLDRQRLLGLRELVDEWRASQ